MRDRRFCPFCGDAYHPPLQMLPLRRFVCTTYQLELAAADLPPVEGWPSLTEGPSGVSGEWEPGLPLTGLQDKLACRHLLAQRWLRLLGELVAYGDALPALELTRRGVSGTHKEDGR